MSAVAVPPPVVPTTPAAAPPAAPALPVIPRSVHSPEDALANRIAAAMAAKPVAIIDDAAPIPPVVAPVVAAPAPDAPAIIEPVVAPPEIDLDSIDFDAPDEPTPVVVAPDTPIEDDALAQAELKTAVTSGDQDAIERAFLRTQRGKDQLAAFKTLRELRKPPAEGGIGRIPSIEDIKAADEASRTLTALRHDVANDPTSFVANLFTINPETGASFLGGPEKAVEVLGTIPQILLQASQQTGNPVYSQMLAAYSTPVFANFFNHQYNMAMAMPQDTTQQVEDKARILDALQVSEAQAFGQARPLNLRQGPVNGHAPTTPDPEVTALRNRLQQYETRFADNQRQTIQNVTQQVEGGARAVAMEDIGKMLKATNVSKVYSDTLLNPLKAEMYYEVHQNLAGLDPTGWQTYQIQLQQAARGQGDPQAATKTYRLLFQNALRSSAAVRTRLNELVQGAKSSSDAQHASLAQAQHRVEPTGMGSPAPQSVLPAAQSARQPGESREDFLTRAVQARMAQLPRQ